MEREKRRFCIILEKKLRSSAVAVNINELCVLCMCVSKQSCLRSYRDICVVDYYIVTTFVTPSQKSVLLSVCVCT